jgi:hypothetical protein
MAAAFQARIREVFGLASTRQVAILRITIASALWLRWGRVTIVAHTYTDVENMLVGQVFLAASTLMFLGILTRWSCLITAVSVYFLTDAGLHGHSVGLDTPDSYYWLFPLLLATTDCGRSFSIDRWAASWWSERMGHPLAPERGSTAGAVAICVLVSLAHLSGAWDRWETLPEALEPMQLAADRPGAFGAEYLGWLETAAYVVPITGFALGIGLWEPRIRVPLIVIGSLTWLILWQAAFFHALPALLIAGYAAFLSPRGVDDTVKRIADDEDPHVRAGSPAPTTDRAQLAARGLLFALALAWMIIPPATYHLVDVPAQRESNKYVRPWFSKGWVMMHGKGIGVCALDFVAGNTVKEQVPVSRYEILGYAGPDDAPMAVRRIYRKDLNGHIQRVCGKVAPDVTLKLQSRCAQRQGWKEIHKARRDVCEANLYPKRGNWRPDDSGSSEP